MDASATKRRRVEGTEEEEEGEEDFGDVRCSSPKPAEGGAGIPLDLFGLTEESVESFISEVEEEQRCAGTGSEDEEKPLLWPAELLEVIFAYLPLRELFSSCRLVCQQWNSVIMRDKFLLWRKRYYMFKCGRCSKVSVPFCAEMKELMQGCTMQGCEMQGVFHFVGQVMLKKNSTNSILQAARYVADRLNHVVVGEEAKADLEQHPQYGCVKRIIEINPTLQPVELTPYTACLHSVHSVVFIALHLPVVGWPHFQPPHCTFIGVTEIFCCFAAVCYALWDMKYFPPRFHYFVFYVMSLLEQGVDSAVAPLERQQPFLQLERSCEVPLTAEQLRVVNCKIKPGEVVKIVALAGTGKTTTLLRYTTLNSHLKFVYCAYNKSVRKYAEKLFPSNVSSHTFHSLAHRIVGHRYQHKRLANLNYYHISQWLDDLPFSSNLSKTEKNESLFRFSKYVLEMLENFVASADPEICLKHLHHEVSRFPVPTVEYGKRVLEHEYAVAVLREAKRMWKGMTDVENSKMKLHDDGGQCTTTCRCASLKMLFSYSGYLKLFQLSRPQITGCDCILVDEAQDLTPAVISVLENQTCSIILVGDPHQQIYGFRGAENAMRQVPSTTTFSLTRSFRFGLEIAYVASLILDRLKHVRRQTLVGGFQSGGIWGEKEHQQGQMAIIARMNCSLFQEMVQVCDGVSASGKRLRVGFTGGIESYDLDMYVEIHKLLEGQSQIKIKYQTFKDFQEIKSHAAQSGDVSLSNKVEVCERYHGRIPQIVQQLKNMNSKDLKHADIVFTTAHKSKGLEFETVRIVDDFLVCKDGRPERYERLPDDEKNLVYVAATRAKKQLMLSPTLLTVLNRANEFFVFPCASAEDLSVTSVHCPRCKLNNCDTTKLPLKRLRIKLSGSPYCSAGGQLCVRCSAEALPCLNFNV